jgi:hypothetical protein
VNLVRLLTTALADPTVRGIILPIAEDVLAWVRSGRPAPAWLEAAGREVPELRAPLALARARLRAGRPTG